MRLFLILVSLAVLPILTACEDTKGEPELIIGAASSLLPLLEEIKPIFENETKVDLNITYAASGTIARQIEQGAPIDVFLSADQLLVEQMVANGFLRQHSSSVIGQSQLVAIRPENGETMTFLDAQIIAIANPETAPYGAAAKRLLENNGVWDLIEGHVVYAESAHQALQFVRTAEANIGLVPLSLVAQNDHGIERIAERIHGVIGSEPIKQIGAITASSNQSATSMRFLEFLTSEATQHAFQSHGYAPIPEDATEHS
jgi:molybdate transport system substrate-binding protein